MRWINRALRFSTPGETCETREGNDVSDEWWRYEKSKKLYTISGAKNGGKRNTTGSKKACARRIDARDTGRRRRDRGIRFPTCIGEMTSEIEKVKWNIRSKEEEEEKREERGVKKQAVFLINARSKNIVQRIRYEKAIKIKFVQLIIQYFYNSISLHEDFYSIFFYICCSIFNILSKIKRKIASSDFQNQGIIRFIIILICIPGR